jgi:membrane fusion protein (multidrug efflux system)
VGTSVYQQTLLNTISSDDPMAVDIAITQAEIPLFNNYLLKQQAKDSTFTLVLPDGTIHPYTGHLILLDRSVDPQTGTLKARLVFPNPNRVLKPGITTNIKVKHSAGDSSLLIPYKAVLEQLGEYYVYLLIKDNKVTQHKVALGVRINDKIVVKSGLQQGDMVVTEGVQKLRDSASVQIGLPKTKQGN